MNSMKIASLAACISCALGSSVAFAQQAPENEDAVLEKITVTAQKRTQSIQEVPISIATLNGDEFNSIFSAGDDILSIALRVPGLYAESSNGRAAPRFYIRGLGNSDFDLAASQPVSIIMDEVVQENVVLKSFPLFDVEQVEVIRGPQGTLFGRNTTAGIVKFDSVKPSDVFGGYGRVSYGSFNSINFEGAVGGGLTDELSARVSVLSQDRDDWIDNGFTGESDALGGYDEKAYRVQLLWEPTNDFTALLNVHGRDLEGSASIFRANIFDRGSNNLNQNYDRDTVYYDGGDGNPQGYEGFGSSLKLEWELDGFTVTSISAIEEADGFSRGDIDGGVVPFSLDAVVPEGISSAIVNVFGTDTVTFPGPIFTPSVTQDSADVEQFTQEIRFASNTSDAFQWQVGGFYFDSSLDVETESFASFGFAGDQQNTIVSQENTTWAVFGQGSYDLSDEWNVTLGLRYTDDEKDFFVGQYGQLWLDLGIPAVSDINREDDNLSWELSTSYQLTPDSMVFGRVASGFRAQSIQGRDVAFLLFPTTAESETIMSYEVGYKSDLLDNRVRLNTAVFYYEIDDIQLSAVGGATNSNQLLNADQGTGVGFEVDLEVLVTSDFLVTAGFAYADTELNDDTLATAACGSGLCTVLDPLDANGNALLDGNSFQQAPETTFNLAGRYTYETENGEIYVYADYVYQGDTNMALYESIEFQTDGQFEIGLRIGYIDYVHDYSIALFGRNITDEDNVKGFVDFSNNTGFVNDPAVYGIEAQFNF
ncbi:TonB-dependent receptor [Alteromonas oceanisediminis]|uniref:TonB-dependent receptor n=1 Tax=Alteromonas oceanisediminis TaxID=2836180 RepID=UPI001BDA3505|nr:TonB-dependent receptor [Alteromonas oceanisediminis]MBT0586395.1 TonB-dependent receptor [Alteromonas oceanisediminis]